MYVVAEIWEVCPVIIGDHKDEWFSSPEAIEEWREIEGVFYNKGSVFNANGALDGKHSDLQLS